jgi:hypothetical protein
MAETVTKWVLSKPIKENATSGSVDAGATANLVFCNTPMQAIIRVVSGETAIFKTPRSTLYSRSTSTWQTQVQLKERRNVVLKKNTHRRQTMLEKWLTMEFLQQHQQQVHHQKP